MPTQLVVIAGPDKGREFPFAPDGVISIGRGSQSHTHLVDLTVSRIHCEVRLAGNQATLIDGKSASGTLVNDKRVTSQTLRAGDIIQVGDTKLRFEHDVADQSTLPPAPAAKNVVFANKPGGRVLPNALKDLHALAGQSLGGFQLLNVLGTGQIGVVFKAKDSKDQKPLALKVLRPDFAKDDKAMKRFVRGMMSTRTLKHPNLVEVYNAGITGQHCWIAMEFIEGKNLAEVLDKMAGAKERDWRLALCIAVYMSRALQVMHDQGMIHRSVIPQNIMVQKSDQVAKLGDAMRAKALDDTAAPAVTASGEFVGNVFYMAPERTKRGNDVDGRADLYSLGVTLYTLLAGRLPFEGASMPEVITKIRQAAPEKPRTLQPSIPEAFEVIVVKMLAKQPAERYQSAKELLAALECVAKAHDA